jgi:hypothetical protein
VVEVVEAVAAVPLSWVQVAAEVSLWVVAVAVAAVVAAADCCWGDQNRRRKQGQDCGRDREAYARSWIDCRLPGL